MLDDDESVLAAMRAGARGYVLKGAGQEELLAAIRAVAAGGAVFGAAVAGRMLATLDRQARPLDLDSRSSRSSPTARRRCCR